MQRLITLFQSIFNAQPTTTKQITGSGSSRQYYRLSNGNDTAIGVIGTSQEENNAFIGLTHHFERQQLPVPHILGISEDGIAYLQSDLGDCSLYDALTSGRSTGNYSEEEAQLLAQTISQLPRMQILGAQGLDTSLCYPTPTMDATTIMFDLNYFKYSFLKLLRGLEFNELKLEQDFQVLTHDILTAIPSEPSLILRDCQARNIMLTSSIPHFIDYQGCRLGPIEYDLASFLWQSSARYPQTLREKLIDIYIQSLSQLRPTDPDTVRRNLRLMVLFRILQVLGAYGFRGYIEHKSYFINSIPPAIDNLRQVLAEGTVGRYPYLAQVLQQVVDFITQQEEAKAHTSASLVASPSQPTPLTVTIWSFSYKRGIPQDPSGNGGGYVFDCRAPHNPGRYTPYKQLTGLDAPVIKFLEDDGEILTFLSHIYPLAESHVARYVERNFTSLTFCFGCTGGQHRSVYSAQHLAEHLRALFPQIRIHLIHREQGIDCELEPIRS